MGRVKEVRISDYGFTIFQIETQAHCNMRCAFCAYTTRKDKTSRLPDDVVFEAIDSVDPTDDKLDYLCMSHFNEALVDKRIFKFIDYAKNRGFKTLVKTNGLLFNSDAVRNQLIDGAPAYIKISFQTLNDEFFRSRGIKYSFDEYKKNIFEFLRLSLDRRCHSAITLDVACNFLNKRKRMMRKVMGLECGEPSAPNTIGEIREDLFVFLKELREFDSRFVFDEGKTTAFLDGVVPGYLDQSGLPITENIDLKIKHFIYSRRLTEFRPVKRGQPCGTRTLGVVSDGTVVPCCFVYDGKLVMGNIKDEPLDSIMSRNRDFIKSIKESGGSRLPGVCKVCKGAPSRRGTHILSLLRHFQNKSNKPAGGGE